MSENDKKSSSSIEKATIVFLALALAILAFNQFQLYSIKSVDATNIQSQVSNQKVPTGLSIVEASVTPTGTPKIYGQELKVSYDDVSPNNPTLADQTIEKLSNLDRTITLQGNDLERYITIASEMSCEYCCGAQSIIVRKEDIEFMNQKIEAAIAAGQLTKEEAEKYRQKPGTAACGCAHSFAMRGLAKYLITKHGSEYTDDQILEEMGKWKTLFFPTPMQQKAAALEERGIEFNYINLASNRFRGIEKDTGSSGSSGGMVGGC